MGAFGRGETTSYARELQLDTPGSILRPRGPNAERVKFRPAILLAVEPTIVAPCGARNRMMANPMPNACYWHPDALATARCKRCHLSLCEACTLTFDSTVRCVACGPASGADRRFALALAAVVFSITAVGAWLWAHRFAT
jgi:hypothetical protein